MAKYTVKPTGSFRKDLKLAKKRGLPLSDLYTVIGMLENDCPCLPISATTCCWATTRVTGNATSIPTGCCSTRKKRKFALYPFIGQELILTFSAKGRKDKHQSDNSPSRIIWVFRKKDIPLSLIF
jgi:hypothetical protein